MTIIAAAVPHHESAGCAYVGGSMHCYIHEVDEVGEGAYRICGECFHVYRTAEDLVATERRWRTSAGISAPPRPIDPDEINSCPECAHDF